MQREPVRRPIISRNYPGRIWSNNQVQDFRPGAERHGTGTPGHGSGTADKGGHDSPPVNCRKGFTRPGIGLYSGYNKPPYNPPERPVSEADQRRGRTLVHSPPTERDGLTADRQTTDRASHQTADRQPTKPTTRPQTGRQPTELATRPQTDSRQSRPPAPAQTPDRLTESPQPTSRARRPDRRPSPDTGTSLTPLTTIRADTGRNHTHTRAERRTPAPAYTRTRIRSRALCALPLARLSAPVCLPAPKVL